MAEPVFENFRKTITTLDNLIQKLELNVGISHKKSPFENFLKKEEIVEKNLDRSSGNNLKENHKLKDEIQIKTSNAKNNYQKNEIDANLLLFKSLDIRVGRIIECWKVRKI